MTTVAASRANKVWVDEKVMGGLTVGTPAHTHAPGAGNRVHARQRTEIADICVKAS